MHFAVFSPPFFSHIRALEAVADELLARGHAVTWMQQEDVRTSIASDGVRFESVGARTHPKGSLAAVVARAAQPGGPFGLRRVILDVAAATDMLCREAPQRLLALGVDAVITDQMEAAGALVADHLGLPCVSVAAALPVNREPGVPLPVMPWSHATESTGVHRNTQSARVYDWMMAPHARVIRRWSRAWGLAPRATLADCASPVLQLSQTTSSFDFPRSDLPPHFHHVGPLRRVAVQAAQTAATSPALDPARPFVFASLGTLQGGRFSLFRRIALACRELDAQLLIAHCGCLDDAQSAQLRQCGATWVTDFAPQREVLAQADVLVTHAGLNTVLDALAAGVPMLALPIAFDQPGVAARVVRAGAGVRVWPSIARVSAIRRSLHQLLFDDAYRQRCEILGTDVRQAGGARLAADLIEAHLVPNVQSASTAQVVPLVPAEACNAA